MFFENRGPTQDPQTFITVLREFHATPHNERGAVANAMADAIIHKRVDLAEVRLELMQTGQADLIDELDRLIDLIEPYIEEGGPETG